MTTRLVVSGKTELSTNLLSRMSVGSNVADLRIWANAQSAGQREKADRLLGHLRDDIDRETPSAALLSMIDGALNTLWYQADNAVPIRALVGLRMVLFGQAPAWELSA
tara:strand:- start:670 stop:993 length:324 start_codon:yes stop_codon:yes gene_type:complete